MFLIALAQLGTGDCEVIGDGVLRQPVNAWSSLAFTVVGIAIAWYARSAEGRERWAAAMFAAALIVTGFGSFLFHGPQDFGAQFLHDVSFLAALWVLIVVNLGGASGVGITTMPLADAGGIGLIGLALAVDAPLTNAISAVLIGGVVVIDVVLWRKAPPRPGWYATAIGALVIAVSLFLAGRTGSPLCDSHGLLQAHAGWHIFAAVALGAYFVATSPARTRQVVASR
jgi:predicted membrane channel-forming protein YqfA (hemolysin III family)